MDRRLAAVTGLALGAALLGIWLFSSHSHQHHAHASLAELDRTYLALAPSAPVTQVALSRTDGKAFSARSLEGRWSLVFFGFTSCPDVCPTALQALSAVAKDARSGVASGATQILFVSTDPERDTPQRLGAYLDNFDKHIVGLRGDDAAVRRFADAAGAGYEKAGGKVDHSTSIFVIDPQGRVAGVLLRSSEPERIVTDLAALQRNHGSPGTGTL